MPSTIKAGDTWPPFRGTAATVADGTVDLSTADSLVLIIKHSSGTPLLEVTPTAIDPNTNDGFNWQYQWSATDTDVIGEYSVELEVTWDAGSTPPHIQSFPNTGVETLTIEDDLGGDA